MMPRLRGGGYGAPLYLTEKQVDVAVRKMYAKNGNVVLSQVRNGTGFSKAARTADLLSVSTWPSRGLYCEGIEIKVSRSDLAHELATPAKADEMAQYCTYWWVAGPAGLLHEGIRLPDSWGFIEVSDKLVAKVTIPAKRLTPKPMDELLVCSIIRTFAATHVHMDEVEPLIKAEKDKAKKEAESCRDYDNKRLREAVEEFKNHSGVDLRDEHGRIHWGIAGIGEAVRLVNNLHRRPMEEVLAAREALKLSMSAIDACVETFQAPQTAPPIPAQPSRGNEVDAEEK